MFSFTIVLSVFGCMGVKRRSVMKGSHIKLAINSLWTDLSLRRSLMLWTVNPSNHHKKMHHLPCWVARGRKMKQHWHSCWWMQQEGMLLHSSLSSLWVIREAACWRQLPYDLDVSCWHSTLTVSWTSNYDWTGHLFETASYLSVNLITPTMIKLHLSCYTRMSKLIKRPVSLL